MYRHTWQPRGADADARTRQGHTHTHSRARCNTHARARTHTHSHAAAATQRASSCAAVVCSQRVHSEGARRVARTCLGARSTGSVSCRDPRPLAAVSLLGFVALKRCRRSAARLLRRRQRARQAGRPASKHPGRICDVPLCADSSLSGTVFAVLNIVRKLPPIAPIAFVLLISHTASTRFGCVLHDEHFCRLTA